jgi:cardiolipin synthase
LVQAITAAQHEVWLETYIFSTAGAGADVAQALIAAAQRGVVVRVVVDGVGTGQLPADWSQRMAQAGVQWRVFSPLTRLGLSVPSRWRRLHRKLCVVDGEVAFCGGINVLDDFFEGHDKPALRHPRLDFAVRLTGPLVGDVRHTMRQLWWRIQAVRDWRDSKLSAAVDALKEVATDRQRMTTGRWRLVLRDNLRHRTRIERHYLHALGRARNEVWIANAYFYPGARLRRALLLAAQRGVRITILVQGHYDHVVPYRAARHLYGPLLAAGVHIHEYHASFMHAKVAVIDTQWVTVGSSNLDPLSLLLAREANVVARDPELARVLKLRLAQVLSAGARQVQAVDHAHRGWIESTLDAISAGLLRLAIFISGKRY